MALSRARIAAIFSAVMGRDNINETFTTHLQNTYADEPALIRGLLKSHEASARLDISKLEFLPPGVADFVRSFPTWRGPGEEGFWIDFLGVRTRTSFFAGHAHMSRAVVGRPAAHDLSELLPILRAAMSSGPTFVMAELGAGWGPWLVKGAFACKAKTGPTRVRLIGVEGDVGHFDFMKQHFADNGLDLADHRLLHGVVGGESGYARFPILNKPEKDWGASIASFSSDLDGLAGSKVFSEAHIEARRAAAEVDEVEFQDVRCYTIAEIIEGEGTVDLIHCDIQGWELRAFEASRSIVTDTVKQVVIGTHSRSIEAGLYDLFFSENWELVHDDPCKIATNARSQLLLGDGVQVWRNPRFD